MYLRRLHLALVLVMCVGYSAASGQSGVLLYESFSTYNNGDLVGQNDWTQLGTNATAPLQMTNGQLVFPAIPTGGGVTVDNQDAYKTFTTVPSPGAGSTSVFVGMDITVSASNLNPSYFFAMTDTPTGFANFRVTARDNSATQADTFQFGGRVTGQGGYPFAYGAPLNYNQLFRLIIQAEMNEGTQNDRILLYINPTDDILGNQTPYAIGEYTTGTGTDATALGLAIFSQFASNTVGQSGLLIDNITVADNFAAVAVPEPTAYALIAITSLGAGGWHLVRRYRQRNAR